MPKDRDQLTPDEPEDNIGQRRAAAREALRPDDPPGGPPGRGPARHGSDPAARDEVPEEEKQKYE
ncbi:MAG TPA: hypothetical protein VKV06_03000 [Acidimicrobiales bacterium]|nr:hypothetical protein [Acidimicrobiales bacterium]